MRRLPRLEPSIYSAKIGTHVQKVLAKLPSECNLIYYTKGIPLLLVFANPHLAQHKREAVRNGYSDQ